MLYWETLPRLGPLYACERLFRLKATISPYMPYGPQEDSEKMSLAPRV